MARLSSRMIHALNGKNYELRSVLPSDAAEFAKLREHIAAESTFTLQKLGFLPSISQIEDSQQKMLQSPKALSIGIFDGQELVGALGLQAIREEHPWIEHCFGFGMFVKKSHWGQGLAKALLTTMHAHTDSCGITRIEATVRSNNPRALGLYVKQGYVVDGRRECAAMIDGKCQDEFFIARRIAECKPLDWFQKKTSHGTLRPMFLCEPNSLVDYFKRNAEHLADFEAQRPEDFLEDAFWTEKQCEALSDYSTQKALRLVVEEEKNKRVLAVINFTQIFRGPFQACYLGFSVDSQAQNKGLASAALREALKFVFHEWKLHKVMASHYPENLKSARVLEKLGFQKDGLSKNYLHLGGRWRDHVLQSLNSEDFEDI